MKITLYNREYISVMKIKNYKDVIKSYYILCENKNEIKELGYTWEIEINISPLNDINYLISPCDIIDLHTFLLTFNKALYNLKNNKLSKREYLMRYINNEIQSTYKCRFKLTIAYQ